MPDMTATLSDKFTRNKPKLLDQVRDVIRLKHYSIRTEQSYIDWIRRFILFHGKRHPRDMTEAEVSSFLMHVKAQHEQDQVEGLGEVHLPFALARKYPNAARE